MRSPVRYLFWLILGAIAILAILRPAVAQNITIGVSSPLSGPFQILGEQFVLGAEAVASQDKHVKLIKIDDHCSPAGGALAANEFVMKHVNAVIGFLCTPALEAALPILSEAGIQVLTPVRTTVLTDEKQQNKWQAWRLGPDADAEANAVAKAMVKHWRGKHFAIVDDGTIYGRNLAEHLRAAAEAAQLQPVFIDTYRPQLDNQIGLIGRLKRAGASHVFVGGDRNDIAIIARDAQNLDYDLILAGGEALRAADENVPLKSGVLMVAPKLWKERASLSMRQELAIHEIPEEGYVIAGVVGLEIATGAVRAALRENKTTAYQLENFTFDTAIGLVRFEENGTLAGDLYQLYKYDGTQFVPLAE